MSPLARWVVGLVFGIFLGFVLFKDSRELMLDGVRLGPSKPLSTTPVLVQNVPRLPPPTTQLARWQWLETAARQRSVERSISSKTRQELIEICRQGAQMDPDNAYWPQAKAVWSRDQGDWRAAARLRRWTDPQEAGLVKLQADLQVPYGPRAWHYGVLWASRSDRVLLQFEGLARQFARASSLTGQDLELRLATLRNGELIRLGARSIVSASAGSQVTEMATFTPEVLEFRSPRRLILSRMEFVRALQGQGRATDAEVADRAFRSNDSWMGLLESDVVADSTRDKLIRAAVSSTLPGGLLYVLGAWLLGWGFWHAWDRRRVQRFHPVPLGAVALVAAAGTYLATSQLLASLVLVACVATLGWSPGRARTEPVLDFGPFYRLAVFAAALILTGLGALFFMGLITPGWELARVLKVPDDYFAGSPLFLGLSVLVTGLTLLLAPALALAYRIRTPMVVCKLLADLHRTGTVLTIGLLMVGVPGCLVLESKTREDLKRIFQNETLYYLSQ